MVMDGVCMVQTGRLRRLHNTTRISRHVIFITTMLTVLDGLDVLYSPRSLIVPFSIMTFYSHFCVCVILCTLHTCVVL